MTDHQKRIEFTVIEDGQRTSETFILHSAVIAGWTGRDAAAVEKHIRELEEMGVARPASTPIFYRVAVSRITTSGAIEVSGGDSSGEVEFVLVKHGGRLYVGVGSDHTDRKAETYNVTVSKQMCEKPVAPELWPFEEVAPHWDELILRSFAVQDGVASLYQEGPVSAMLAPADLMTRAGGLDDGTAMFCGTLAARGGIRPAPRFQFEIEDPRRGRRISHAYDVLTLPVAG